MNQEREPVVTVELGEPVGETIAEPVGEQLPAWVMRDKTPADRAKCLLFGTERKAA